MFIVNQVINFNETPGLLFDSVVSAEEANLYPLGSIVLDQNTHNIYRAEGTPGSQTWVEYGGGAGSTPNLIQVLNVGNNGLSSSIIFQQGDDSPNSYFNQQNLFFYKDDVQNVFLQLTYEFVYIVTDDTDCAYGTNFVSYHNSINNHRITGRFNSVNSLFQFEYNENPTGILLDFGNFIYSFGDVNNDNNGTKLIIDDNQSIITMQTGEINLNGINLISGSSGSTSGNHLVVYINGNQYKIELKNP